MRLTKKKKNRQVPKNKKIKSKKCKCKKGGGLEQSIEEELVKGNDYDSDFNINDILMSAYNKPDEIDGLLDQKDKEDNEDLKYFALFNKSILTRLNTYEHNVSDAPFDFRIEELSDLYKDVISETLFGIELELCVKIPSKDISEEISFEDQSNKSMDVRTHIYTVFNNKLNALMNIDSMLKPERKWNYILSRTGEKGSRRFTLPSGEYSFGIDNTKYLSGKKWSLIDDASIECDQENNYFRTEIVSPVLKMGNTDKMKYPEDTWSKITLNNSIDYDEGIEVIKNVLESVIKSDVDAQSISKIGGIIIQNVPDTCSLNYRGQNSCGMHVHMSNKYMTGNSRLGKYLFWNLARNWYFFEPILSTLLSLDRFDNYYAQNINKGDELKNQVFNVCNIDKMKWIIDNMSLTQIANLYLPPIKKGRKYYKINFNFVRKACREKSSKPLQIEIRSHQGTHDFSEIRNWTYICTGFLSNTITSSLLSLTQEQANFLEIPREEIDNLTSKGFLTGNTSTYNNDYLESTNKADNFINGNMFDKLFESLLFKPHMSKSLKKYYFNKIKILYSEKLTYSRPRQLRLFKNQINKLINDLESDEKNKEWLDKDVLHNDLWGENINGVFIPNEEFISFKKI